jgi:hypothetical protein
MLGELGPHPDFASAVAAVAERKDVRQETLAKALTIVDQVGATLLRKH